jgi:hypothetical protein
MRVGSEMPTITQAILWTIAYADVFDYPLTLDEIHWYLWGYSATCEEVEDTLLRRELCPMHLSHVSHDATDPHSGYYTLPGRELIVALRHHREGIAVGLWRKAWTYAHLIAQLPYVRMVALTGSLAMGNVQPGADIDYLIITEQNRLWLCRATVIALGLLATRQGDIICPNYFLSERALAMTERNLYTAHEIAQMIPLYNVDAYEQIQRSNSWVRHYLPNAMGLPCLTNTIFASRPAVLSHMEHPRDNLVKKTAEAALRTRTGARLEEWEMGRKLRKYRRELELHPESDFSSHCCKGHFNDHMARTHEFFTQRLQSMGAEPMEGWIMEAYEMSFA